MGEVPLGGQGENCGQRFAAPRSLPILIDNLPRLRRYSRKGQASKRKSDEDGEQACAHEDHLYERRSMQKVSLNLSLGAQLYLEQEQKNASHLRFQRTVKSLRFRPLRLLLVESQMPLIHTTH